RRGSRRRWGVHALAGEVFALAEVGGSPARPDLGDGDAVHLAATLDVGGVAVSATIAEGDVPELADPPEDRDTLRRGAGGVLGLRAVPGVDRAVVLGADAEHDADELQAPALPVAAGVRGL